MQRTAVEFCKQSLMDHSNGSLEDSSTENNEDHKVPALEVSEGNKCFNINWARGQSCNILSKNMAVFCSSSGKLTESKCKRNGLISFVEEISGLHTVEYVA